VWAIILTAAVATLATIGIIYPLKIIGDVGVASQDQITPLSSLSDTASTAEIKEAIVYVSQKYLVDESQLMQTIKCESGFRHAGVFGDKSEITGEFLAYGIAQFHKPTFDRYCAGSYYSAKDQLTCMAEMLKKGLGSNWTCWRRYFST